MLQILVVGAGGFVGAVARYTVSGWVHRVSDTALPVGTLVVNLVGCLIIGALMAWVEVREALSPSTRLFLTIGLLGSFTTFSTLGYETYEMLRSGELRQALLYIVGSAVLGLFAVAAGRGLVRVLTAA